MRTLKLTKSFKDVSINNVFVFERNDKLENIQDTIRLALKNAKEKICFVLEDGMNDTIAQMLEDTQASKYLIVPKIEESKYQRLKNSIIAREVDNIKGNYMIIDAEKLFFFDDEFNGYIVEDGSAVDVIQQLFLREFWENGQKEFIESKKDCAEVTFDVPPIYGSDTALLDDSFGSETKVEALIKNSKTLAFTQKAESHDGIIFIKDAKLNSNFLKTSANMKVYLAQQLPCCLASDGKNTYILNFDIAKYRTLPERRKGRLFAVKCANLPMGITYRFFKHKTIEELVNADVLSCEEDLITVLRTAKEYRKILTDLRMATEYQKMDEQTLEARLEKSYPDLFQTDIYAASVTYNITVEIDKRKLNRPAEIYDTFDMAKKKLRDKWKEVLSVAKELKLDKKIAQYEIDIDGIADRVAYKNALTKINEAVSRINDKGHDDIDEALKEVTSKKQKIDIQPLNAVDLKMDIPANGKLYQDKDTFEYVLTSESNLSAAMEEMKLAGIENIQVRYLTE